MPLLGATLEAWLRIGTAGAGTACAWVTNTPPGTTEVVGMGMPIFDNMDLRAVSELARQHQRSTFMLVAAPLKVEGATGSPLNPIAIF